MKSKTPVVVALVLIGAVVAFLALSDFSSQDTPQNMSRPPKTADAQKGATGIDYQSFTIIMDRILGKDNWQAGSNKVGANSTLMINDLSFTFKYPTGAEDVEVAEDKKDTGAKDDKNKVKPTPDKTQASSEVPPISLTVNIATVEVGKGLTKKDLEATLASPDWVNKKALHLTEGLTLKDISLQYEVDSEGLMTQLDIEDELVPGSVLAKLNIEGMAFDGLTLAATDATAPVGPAGFLKALRLDNFNYQNLILSAEELGFEAKMGSFEVADFGFTGRTLAGLDTLDPSLLTSVLSSFTAKSSTSQNLSLTLKAMDQEAKGTKSIKDGQILITVAKVEDRDIQLAKVGETKISGVKLEIDGFEAEAGVMPIIFSVDQLAVIGLDAQNYLNKTVPGLINLTKALQAENYMGAMEAMGSAQTLGDVLFPYSLETVRLKGLTFKLGGQLSIALAEGNSQNPFKEGQIPASSMETISGLVITLNDDPKKAVGDFGQGLYEFGQAFGQTRFEIDAESVKKYDAQTGIFSFQDSRVTVKNLFEIVSNMKMSGLTAKQLESMNTMPLSVAVMALVMSSPDPVFGNIALDNMSLKITDQGLTERILKFAHVTYNKKMGADLSFKTFQELVAMGAGTELNPAISPYLTNSEVLTKALSAFLLQPQSLELSLNPSPPLSASFMLKVIMAEDANKFINSLNLTLEANGQESPPLNFTLPSGL